MADSITGVNDVEVIATGNADLRKQDKRLTADKITFWDLDAEVEAVGNVHLTQNKDSVEGPYLRMKTEEETGFFDRPVYRMERKPKIGSPILSTFDEAIYPGEVSRSKEKPVSIASGAAERMDFEGKDKFRFTNGTYSTCQPAQGEAPDWYAQASSLNLDYVQEEGIGRNAVVYFQGMPILYSPWMSFALNNKRRSGLLAPSIGSSTKGGFQYSQPIYWNIAPEMDATFTPKFIAKRGTLLQGEYRYIASTQASQGQPAYSGLVNARVLPNDKITGTSRSSLSFTHNHPTLGNGFAGSLTFNGVSDQTFLNDLSNSLATTAQTNLLRQGTLTYSAPSGWWSAGLTAQSYQTLQDPRLPAITKPYTTLPSLTLAANRSDLPLGMVFGFSGQYVNYSNPTLVEATRLTSYPQLSVPLLTAATYITPKIGLHSTQYSFHRQATRVPDTLSRHVPIFSVDSGVVFEREANWFAKEFTQTLEPRLHYLYVPYKDQNILSNGRINFDSGLADFNFATIFSENRYVGGDRVGDANQITAMLASRLLDPESGAEIVRGAVGQRFYFTDQKVSIAGEPLPTARKTDLLASLSGRVAPHVYIDTGTQYSQEFARTERLTLSTRYQPEIGKALSASYRYNRNQLGQVDLTAQWPLRGSWNMVGRINYSTKEKRLIENLAGVEYDAGCWAARAVMQQFVAVAANSTPTAPEFTSTFAFMFQLELKGFSSLGFGENAQALLKRQIPGYGIINSSTIDPSLSNQ